MEMSVTVQWKPVGQLIENPGLSDEGQDVMPIQSQRALNLPQLETKV